MHPRAAVRGAGIVLLIVMTRLLYICQPNEVLIFSGARRVLATGRVVGYQSSNGGRRMRRPPIEAVDRKENREPRGSGGAQSPPVQTSTEPTWHPLKSTAPPVSENRSPVVDSSSSSAKDACRPSGLDLSTAIVPDTTVSAGHETGVTRLASIVSPGVGIDEGSVYVAAPSI
jgi:hypothetical protein